MTSVLIFFAVILGCVAYWQILRNLYAWVQMKYGTRARENFSVTLLNVMGFAFLSLHYFMGVTMIPYGVMFMFSVALILSMQMWRDRSFAYERFIYAYHDYLTFQQNGWEHTQKAQLLIRVMKMQWEMMSKQEKDMILGEGEIRERVTTSLQEINIL